MRNVKNLKNGKGQKSSLNNQTISVLLSIYTCIAYWLPAPDTTALVALRDKPQGENDCMPQVQVRSGEKMLGVTLGKHLSPDDTFPIDKIEHCAGAVMFIIYQEKVVPDMTALVTLRDKNLGGNDSMPPVQVRHHYFSNPHESCFQLTTGSEFTFDYNRYWTSSVRFEYNHTCSLYRHTGSEFKTDNNRYNVFSIIFNFNPTWSRYGDTDLIQHVTGSNLTFDYNRYVIIPVRFEYNHTCRLYRHTGSEFKTYNNRHNVFSIIFNFNPTWSRYGYTDFIPHVTGSNITFDYNRYVTILYLSNLSTTPLVVCTETPDLN